ncbi:hypothetical protein GGR51DRAFT_568196 [Nemania sp. FL0031]|nr:hypothetical protein GGR51DRAFT_568196 [Nemania sp. FL0031]
MFSIIAISVRAFLLFIAAIVIGLSVTLAKQQVIGPVPPETGFGTFVGAAGFFASALGLADLWFDRINGMFLMGLDAFVSVLYLAGAISLTVAMKDVPSCTSASDLATYLRGTNKILSGGCVYDGDDALCPHALSADGKDLTIGRCQMAQVDFVLEYTGFVFGLLMLCVGYLLCRRGRGGTPRPTNRTYL